MTQIQQVSQHLEEGKSITSMQAFDLYGCTRLAAIICTLRRNGKDIKSKDVAAKNRYGGTVHFSEYYMEKSET